MGEKELESMTISMDLLCLFVLVEMIGLSLSANALGAMLSFSALLIHGANVLASTIVVGPCRYLRLFKCWLELGILVVDSVALWISLLGLRNPDDERTTNRTYFYFFG